MINQPEGYLEPNGLGTYDYGYRLKDHLGNIRITFVDFDHNGSIALSEITEENNYYPFGLEHQGYNNIVNSNANAVANKFKYNSKELNDELGLNLYDYGARFYDPAIGRWHVLDPLSERYKSWSPYNYAVNSPIRFLDPNGMSVADAVWNEWINELGTSQTDENEKKETAEEAAAKKKLVQDEITKKLNQTEDVDVAQSGGGVTIDNTAQALSHYLFGDGSPARIGPKTVSAILNHPDFALGHNQVMNNKLKKNSFSVDMTWSVFHVGDTRVSYSIDEMNRNITYTLFDGDGFWDADFIDENTLGKWGQQYFQSDGMGPNLERFGGTPYYYIPVSITFSY